MQRELQIQIPVERMHDNAEIKKLVCRKAGFRESEVRHIEILKRSVDARQRAIKFNLSVRVYLNEDHEELTVTLPDYKEVSKAPPVLIVGAGPAGLFAALRCLEAGIKPVILERGKDVRSRVEDLKAINIHHQVNPDSNYCFGEGGAGTYSDGKLYTRSKKRGDTDKIIRLLVAFGADKDIMVDAHPHIGTNKLPGIIKNIRECIMAHGGEIHFNHRVTDILIKDHAITGVATANGSRFEASHLILATGHSARDIYELLHQKKILLEPKPFALGVRVEHPQSLIDSIQYKRSQRGPYLPPAYYSFVKNINRRSIYSFCMCPGGVIAPCATAPGEVVTNGWSPSRRDFPTANSGVVVGLRPDDYKQYASFGPLAGLEFQKAVEQKAWTEAGRTQKVPAQRLTDFIRSDESESLPATSYKPGVTSVELFSVLPHFVYAALQDAFIMVGKGMKGYITEEAVVHAPESRTSSPVRVPRLADSLQHPQIKGLYPCGEGAGYAGGIVSAAIDGERCAGAIALDL